MNLLEAIYINDKQGLEEYVKTYGINEEKYGQTPLFWAVFHNNLSFVKYLVHKGADINKKDRLGRTPLIAACYFNFEEIADFLIESGANTEGCKERAMKSWDKETDDLLRRIEESIESTKPENIEKEKNRYIEEKRLQEKKNEA